MAYILAFYEGQCSLMSSLSSTAENKMASSSSAAKKTKTAALLETLTRPGLMQDDVSFSLLLLPSSKPG
jgi:hypothetical protein